MKHNRLVQILQQLDKNKKLILINELMIIIWPKNNMLFYHLLNNWLMVIIVIGLHEHYIERVLVSISFTLGFVMSGLMFVFCLNHLRTLE